MHYSRWCGFNVRLKHPVNPHNHCLFIHPSSALTEVHHVLLIIWKLRCHNLTVSGTLKNIYRFQNLHGCTDGHRQGCTLGIAFRLPNLHSATPYNFKSFPCIVCKRNRSLVHVQNVILVSCWFRNFWTNDTHNEIHCICDNFLGRALGFVCSEAKDKTLCTNKPAGGVVLGQPGLIIERFKDSSCLHRHHRYCSSHSFFSQFKEKGQQCFCMFGRPSNECGLNAHSLPWYWLSFAPSLLQPVWSIKDAL